LDLRIKIFEHVYIAQAPQDLGEQRIPEYIKNRVVKKNQLPQAKYGGYARLAPATAKNSKMRIVLQG
jgi:hypothetical protein